MRQNRPIIIGLTGNIGSGKTTVARFFTKRGARIIDADRLAHQLLEPKTPTAKKLIRSFGPVILNRSHSIDRHRLARFAFASYQNWKLLCRITHPEVIRLIKKEIRQACQDKVRIVVIDAALLIESGADRLVNYVIVVKADLKQQLERAKTKLGISPQDFRRRLKFQLPIKDKIREADFIIYNNKVVKLTERQVEEIWKKIMDR